MLGMPTFMQSVIRIRRYIKMFSDFGRQELSSSQISTLDDLGGSGTRCAARLSFS